MTRSMVLSTILATISTIAVRKICLRVDDCGLAGLGGGLDHRADNPVVAQAFGVVGEDYDVRHAVPDRRATASSTSAAISILDSASIRTIWWAPLITLI